MNFSLSRKSRKSGNKYGSIRDLFKSGTSYVPTAVAVTATSPDCAQSEVVTLGGFGQIMPPRPRPVLGSIPLAGLRARSNSLDLDGWPARSSSSVGYEVKHVTSDDQRRDSRMGYLWGVPFVPLVEDPLDTSISQTQSIGRAGLKSRFFGSKRKMAQDCLVQQQPDASSKIGKIGLDDSGRKYMTLPTKRGTRGTFIGHIWSAETNAAAKEPIDISVQRDSVVPINFPPLPPTPVVISRTLDTPLTPVIVPSPSISASSLFSPVMNADENRESSSTASTVVPPTPDSDAKAIEMSPGVDVDHQRSMEDMQRAYKRMREISGNLDDSTCESLRSSVVISTKFDEERTVGVRQSLTFEAIDTALKAAVSENITLSEPGSPPSSVKSPGGVDRATDKALDVLQEAARAVLSPRRARASSIHNTPKPILTPSTPGRSARRSRTCEETGAPRTPTRVRILEPADLPSLSTPTVRRVAGAKALGLGRPSSTPVVQREPSARLSSFSYLNAPAGCTPDAVFERQNDTMVVLLLRKLAERDEENRKLREQIIALEQRK